MMLEVPEFWGDIARAALIWPTFCLFVNWSVLRLQDELSEREGDE